MSTKLLTDESPYKRVGNPCLTISEFCSDKGRILDLRHVKVKLYRNRHAGAKGERKLLLILDRGNR
jgi:hypothetical protein